MAKLVFRFATFAGAVRACVAVSYELGYPKVEGVAIDGTSPAPRVVPCFVRPRRVPDGHALYVAGYRGVAILPVDHPLIVPLDGQVLEVPATYAGLAVPGGAGTMTVNLAAGVVWNQASHDIAEEDLA